MMLVSDIWGVFSTESFFKIVDDNALPFYIEEVISGISTVFVGTRSNSILEFYPKRGNLISSVFWIDGVKSYILAL